MEGMEVFVAVEPLKRSQTSLVIERRCAFHRVPVEGPPVTLTERRRLVMAAAVFFVGTCRHSRFGSRHYPWGRRPLRGTGTGRRRFRPVLSLSIARTPPSMSPRTKLSSLRIFSPRLRLWVYLGVMMGHRWLLNHLSLGARSHEAVIATWIQLLIFGVGALINHKSRASLPWNRQVVTVCAVVLLLECAGAFALLRISAMKVPGFSLIIDSSSTLLITMALSSALLRRRYSSFAWVAGIIVVAGACLTFPPGAISIGSCLLGAMAFALPSLGMIGKEMLLKGLRMRAEPSSKPLGVFAVAFLSTAAQLLTFGHWDVGLSAGYRLRAISALVLAGGALRLVLLWALKRGSSSLVQFGNALAIPLGVALLAPSYSNQVYVGLCVCLAGLTLEAFAPCDGALGVDIYRRTLPKPRSPQESKAPLVLEPVASGELSSSDQEALEEARARLVEKASINDTERAAEERLQPVQQVQLVASSDLQLDPVRAIIDDLQLNSLDLMQQIQDTINQMLIAIDDFQQAIVKTVVVMFQGATPLLQPTEAKLIAEDAVRSSEKRKQIEDDGGEENDMAQSSQIDDDAQSEQQAVKADTSSVIPGTRLLVKEEVQPAAESARAEQTVPAVTLRKLMTEQDSNVQEVTTLQPSLGALSEPESPLSEKAPVVGGEATQFAEPSVISKTEAPLSENVVVVEKETTQLAGKATDFKAEALPSDDVLVVTTEATQSPRKTVTATSNALVAGTVLSPTDSKSAVSSDEPRAGALLVISKEPKIWTPSMTSPLEQAKGVDSAERPPNDGGASRNRAFFEAVTLVPLFFVIAAEKVLRSAINGVAPKVDAQDAADGTNDHGIAPRKE